MKKINSIIKGRSKRVLAFMSLLVMCTLLAGQPLSFWGSHKKAITGKLSTSFAFLGVAAGLKAKKKEGSEKTAYDELDANTKSFVDSIDEVLKGLSEGRIDSKGVEDQLTKFEEKHGKGLNVEQMKSFTDMVASVKAQAIELQKLKDDGVKTETKQVSFLESVTKALEEHKEKLTEAANSKSGSFQFRLKVAPAVITTDTAASGDRTYLPIPTFLPAPFIAPVAELNIMQLINMTPSDSPQVVWVNEQPVNGDAAYTAEGALKSQEDIAYVNENATSVKVTAFMKVTTQALRNIKFLANRINTKLAYTVRNKVEDGLINGAGGTELSGVANVYAPGFTTTSFNDSVTDPQIFDAIMCMAGQIDELLFTPNTVMMHPVDVRKMKLVKNNQGTYLLPPFAASNGTYIDNMRVVPNRKIAVGFALVGDFSKFNAFMLEDLMIDIGLDADDFTKNRRTILAEMELGSFMSAIEVGAFCYDAIATVITAITAPTI